MLPIESEIPILGNGRPDQLLAYEAFNTKLRTLFVAPTGYGKSLVGKCCAIREVVESDWQMRQVFFGPQRTIVNQFSGGRFGKTPKIQINGVVYRWEPINQCGPKDPASVVELKRFLLDFNNRGRDRDRVKKVVGHNVILVSNSAMVIAWEQLLREQPPEVIKKIIKYTSFRSDECHHIEIDITELGKFVRSILADDYGRLHLMTATFLRGNMRRIVDVHDPRLPFKIHKVPWLNHWRCLGLESMTHAFVTYRDAKDVMEQMVQAHRNEPNESFCDFVPGVNQGFFRGEDKKEWVREYIRRVKEIHPKGLDLIENQDEDKLYLDSKEEFNYIVACGMGREGMDRAEISRVQNGVVDRSVLSLIQKGGRALRYHKDKKNVVMTNYIPYIEDWETPEAERVLAGRVNAVVFTMISSDWSATLPSIPAPDNPDNPDDPKPPRRPPVDLEEIFGENMVAFLEEMVRRIPVLPEKTGAAIDDLIETMLIKYHIVFDEADHDRIIDSLRKKIVGPNHLMLVLAEMGDIMWTVELWNKLVSDCEHDGWWFADMDEESFGKFKEILDTHNAWDVNFAVIRPDWRKVWNDFKHPLNRWLHELSKSYDSNTLEGYKRECLNSLPGWKTKKFDKTHAMLARIP